MNLRSKFTIASAAFYAAAVFLSAADIKLPTQLFLIRIYLTTNTIPGWYGSSTLPTPGPDGYLPIIHAANADLVAHPPTNVVVTNYVIGYFDGTNSIRELLTIKSP